MKEVFLTKFMEGLIVGLEKEQRDGTAHVYKSTLNRVRKFMNGREMSFKQLTSEWLSRFEQRLLAEQLKWNTVSTYMRMLRSIYNQALESGVATYIPRLFSNVHTGVDSPVKRAVSPEVMSRLMKNEEKLSRKLSFSRDVFVLLFLLRGMSFVDLAFLRKCDMQGDIITYHRHKTGRKMTVVACAEAMAIIEKYRDESPDSPYLFPIIKNPQRNEYRQYTCMLRLENYRLIQLARTLNIRERLSTYTARHTWATTALRQNYNSNLICDAMGHSSVKVTETYFQPFKEAEINRMNQSIVAFVLSKNG
ncbi:tyrosine-type recombinase/integrase [Bacteroides sp. UBA939]|uniref:tyrosine-type recombinase/integrase n=1 Tax=Bacteroides sp. UBA939 TaxID=1946092 RepID=UPI0025C4A9B0|nr:site-specific integrase [Bacteroides sp. UBA939]